MLFAVLRCAQDLLVDALGQPVGKATCWNTCVQEQRWTSLTAGNPGRSSVSCQLFAGAGVNYIWTSQYDSCRGLTIVHVVDRALGNGEALSLLRARGKHV